MLIPAQWKNCSPQLDVMGEENREVRGKAIGRVQWRPPDEGWLKLNVDGAFSQASQRAGGGGVLRNYKGDTIAAFSAGVEGNSGMEAEVAAFLLGVILAKQHGSRLWIESDADRVVRWLVSGQHGPVAICTDLLKIRKELQGLDWRVTHIFREGKQPISLQGLDCILENRLFTQVPRLLLGSRRYVDWINLVYQIFGSDMSGSQFILRWF